MKKLLTLIFFLNATIAHASGYGDLNDVEYVKNYDGDTITFNIKSVHPIIGDKIPIRVNGIDTPEIKGKCEKESILAKKVKEFVKQEMKQAKTINLRNINREKYFRILADVEYDNKLLSQELIKRNMAVEYHGETKLKNWCE